jgi:hypothetical protein
MNTTTRLAESSAPHIENNGISTQQGSITSEEFTINATIDNEKEEIEGLPSKFEYQYALCEEG